MLAGIEEDQQHQAFLNSQAIALFAQSFSYSKGVKEAKTIWFNPYELQKRKEQAREIYPERSASLLLDLSANQQLPAWVVGYLDLESIRLAVDD